MLVHQRGADIEPELHVCLCLTSPWSTGLWDAGLAEDRGNYAQQTSLHTACEGNYANIAVDLLAAGEWSRGHV